MSQDDDPPAFRRLPPLNALRAFEAAARRLSITDAAKELAVTAGAVSQQIKLLEEHAGSALFVRIGRTVELAGPLDEPQRARLLEIADKCPVHRLLTHEVKIVTRFWIITVLLVVLSIVTLKLR